MLIGNARLNAIAVAFLMILTIPTIAGIDLNTTAGGTQYEGEGVDHLGLSATDDRTWVQEIPAQISRPAPTDQPWWVITSRDSNRNHVVDSLETLATGEEAPLVISFSRPIAQTDLDSLKELGIEGGYVVDAINAISIGLRDVTLIPDLVQLPGVIMVERSELVHLLSDVATRAIKARGSEEYSPESAWELTNVTGYGINVAVVDTGIDDGHPSLEGKRVAGYDAVTPEARTDGEANPDDRNGHGTSCSGMATGTSKGDPDLAYMGSGPGATLIDVQIGTDVGAGPFENYLLPTTYYDSALRGIEWVMDNADTEWSWVEPEHYGIDVMSLSWGITSHENGGSDGSDPFSRLIDEVVGVGVVSVGAAGNDGPSNDGLSGMSASSEAIIIGATDDHNTIDRSDDTIAGYSSRGPRKSDNDGYPYDELKPDVSAPGTNIWNTDPCTTSEGCYGDADGNGYEGRGSGTSYATPAVAGVTTLILEANPDLTPAHVKEILHLTSERRGPASEPDLDPFWNRDFGYGMVDAYEAVKVAMELVGQDLDAIDVELQAHVTNVTATSSGGAMIEGLAWAKVGTVEDVLVSVDGKNWVEVEYLDVTGSAETGEFITWRFEVKASQLGWTGDHMIHVKAVSGNSQSLSDSASFVGVQGDEDDDGIGSTTIAMIAAFALIFILGLILFIVKGRDDEDDDLDEVDELENASDLEPGEGVVAGSSPVVGNVTDSGAGLHSSGDENVEWEEPGNP
jgi:subtilisin family serine protease